MITQMQSKSGIVDTSCKIDLSSDCVTYRCHITTPTIAALRNGFATIAEAECWFHSKFPEGYIIPDWLE